MGAPEGATPAAPAPAAPPPPPPGLPGSPPPPRPPPPPFFDADRPRCHVQPPAGWMNDPNGPVFYRGRYHLFYQYLPEACEWDFGIAWGHAVSADLVRWEHLPPALVPTPGWLDADGCFSGCCVVDPATGRPTILYTGVRLRSNAAAGPPPPAEHDLGMVWIEAQLRAAPADADDDLLVRWRKEAAPALHLPPAHLSLTGWRDPFVVPAPRGGWRMLIGSGLKGRGGAALVYHSAELDGAWELEGTLCEGEAADTGVVWECPLLVPLAPVPRRLRGRAGAPPAWLHPPPPAAAAGVAASPFKSGAVAFEFGPARGRAAAAAARAPSAELWPPGGADAAADGDGDDDDCSAAAAPDDTADGADLERAASLSPWASSDGAAALSSAAAAAAPAAEDRFAAALSRVPALSLGRAAAAPPPPARLAPPPLPTLLVPRPALLNPPPEPASPATPAAPASPPAPAADGLAAASSNDSGWHLFTVSPDAPQNPVLYWTGAAGEDEGGAARFALAGAKGPFRLDLGDVLYAPNACPDAAGRWLLWGWLQERRKVGSYAYAGCLSAPRTLHVSAEGRLLQAPAEEVARLRAGRRFVAEGLVLQPDALLPLEGVSGERLDIELTLERGSAAAAGLLLRSYEAEAEGSTALIYDWERGTLEAVFNVPPSWQPSAPLPAAVGGAAGERDVFSDGEGFDPVAALFSPRPPPPPTMSRETSIGALSALLEDEEFSSAAAGGSAAWTPTGSGASSPRGSLRSPRARASAERAERLAGAGGSSLSIAIQRSGSTLAAALAGACGGFAPGSLPVAVGAPGGLAASPSLPRMGSFSRLGASLPRSYSSLARLSAGAGGGLAALTAAASSPGSPRGLADADGPPAADADLDRLLEDLAAPMRAAGAAPAPPPPEPRRVGGPLLMRPRDALHLRVLLDHSCLEVFAGSGEVLSTRVYRGAPPEGARASGVEFVAFGGAALLTRVAAYEMGSAWAAPSGGATPAGSAAATPAAAAPGGLGPLYQKGASEPATPATAVAAAAVADVNALFDAALALRA